MEKISAYFKNNPEEVQAIIEGKAMPLGLSAVQIIELIKEYKADPISAIKKYWM